MTITFTNNTPQFRRLVLQTDILLQSRYLLKSNARFQHVASQPLSQL